jgi:hypothetical protein
MTSDPKLCVDCKHIYWPPCATGSDRLIADTAVCEHPDQWNEDNPVVGQVRRRCADERRAGHKCGMNATLYEPRIRRA